MKIKEIMTKKIEMIDASHTVSQAAKKMESLNVGILAVRKDDSIVGMITDRDIVIRALASDRSADTAVEAVMTPEVARCYAEDDIESASDIMKDRQVRRLIVLDGENVPVGIISLGDIAAKSKSDQLAGRTLETVSQPCEPAC